MTTLAAILNPLLSLGIILLQISLVAVVIGMILRAPFVSFVAKHANLIIMIVFVGAAIGSLVYEHVLHYPPCILCWYQRLAIFPIAFLASTDSITTNKLLRRQVFALAIYGAIIGLFHNFLDIFQPSGLSVCGADGVSCAARYVYEFGYITIPMMSLTILLTAVILVTLVRRYPQAILATTDR